MIVSHLKLKNWRNFRTVDISIGQRVFLVGPNASGKSNFLDAFRFLRDIAKPGGGLQKSVKDRGGLSKIRCLAARKDPRIEIEIELHDSFHKHGDSWRYAISIKQETSGYRHALLDYEKVWKNGSPIIERPDKDDREDTLRLTQTYLEQINANVRFREIAKYFQTISYLHLVPQLLRHPESFTGPSMPDDPFGRDFLAKVAQTPNKTRIARLRKIEKALKGAVPQLEELSHTRDNKGISHLEAVYKHWRPKAGKQSEREFSDGTLRLIGFLWSLLAGDSLLLLEEPELSLHPGIIKKLPGLIWRIQSRQKRQIIISTHSPELLSSNEIGGEEVLMLTPDEEGTKVELVSQIRDVRDLLEQGLSLSEVIIPRTEPKDIVQLDIFNE